SFPPFPPARDSARRSPSLQQGSDMSVPDVFLAELAKRRLDCRLWLEIEGIGSAFGIFAADASWWSGFPERETFDRVLNLSAEVPNFSSQSLNHVAGRVSLGTCGVVVAERDGVLHDLFATRRGGPVLTL